MKPNIVFIVFDTARASAFEPWGAPAGSTPAVSQLASRGTAVEHAVAASNWTLPSHAAMFTGGLPRTVGLCDVPEGRAGYARPVLEAHHGRLLPEVLRRAGYRTEAASANAWVSRFHGFDTGFDTFVDVRGKRHTGIDKLDWQSKLAWAWQALIGRVDDGARAAFAAARQWRTDAPFFWFFNLVECHSPYLPPRPWNPLGAKDRVLAEREARRHLTLDAIWRTAAKGEHVPDDALERMRALYQRSVSLMDDWLARLLTLLDQRGVLDDTWIVLTSDHGENLGECGLLGHVFSLDERLLHVPLVIAGPDALSVPAFFSTVGLPALMGGMAQLAANPWTRSGPETPDGIAVAQYDAIVRPGDPRLDDLSRWWSLDDRARRVFTDPMTAATDGRRKLVRHGDAVRLLDLATDPREAAPTEVDPMVAAPDLWAAIQASDTAAMDPAVLAALVADAREAGDDGLADQMRLLGYL